MYMELYYLLSVFSLLLLCWLSFVNYKLDYLERIGPKVGSSFDLNKFEIIDSFQIKKNSKEEQIYILLSPDCSQCNEAINKIRSNQAEYKKNFTIVVVGEYESVIEWKKVYDLDLPLVCLDFEQAKRKLKVNLFPFAIKVKDFKVIERTAIYEQYLFDDTAKVIS